MEIFMSDHDRLLQLAGLKSLLVEDSQVNITSSDVESNADSRVWERNVEQNIKRIARQIGIDLVDNYPIHIDEANIVEVKIDTGSGMPLAHLLRFANALAANRIGSDLKIQGSADLYITVEFTLNV
jgi:hypothetical protein